MIGAFDVDLVQAVPEHLVIGVDHLLGEDTITVSESILQVAEAVPHQEDVAAELIAHTVVHEVDVVEGIQHEGLILDADHRDGLVVADGRFLEEVHGHDHVVHVPLEILLEILHGLGDELLSFLLGIAVVILVHINDHC